MILSQQLPPGARLIEADLAERFGVSRIPVREALHLLEATGLVEVVPRKGARVAVVDGTDIMYIQELRIAIEGYTAEAAALRRGPEDIEELSRCVEMGLTASKSGDTVGAANAAPILPPRDGAGREEPVFAPGPQSAPPAHRDGVLGTS